MKHASRRSLVASSLAGILAVSGVIVIAVAIAGQERAPQPPLSAAGSLERSAANPATPVPHPSAKPAPELALPTGKDEHPVLRLVTCGGPFDDSTGHYLDNIVVFASLVGSH